jgi:hypothetical protein
MFQMPYHLSDDTTPREAKSRLCDKKYNTYPIYEVSLILHNTLEVSRLSTLKTNDININSRGYCKGEEIRRLVAEGFYCDNACWSCFQVGESIGCERKASCT